MSTTSTKTKTKTKDFVSVLALTPSPDQAIGALATVDGISRWWGPTSGSAAAGGVFQADFDEGRTVSIEVASFSPQRVEWTVLGAPHTPEWVGTTIVFELMPAGAGTELRFRHAGLTPQLECYDFCFAGWAHFLASLSAYVNTGQGSPHRSA